MAEYPTYLIHYGIQGQKWGVRRFQNEDGSLTPEGIERYSKLLDRQNNSSRDYKKLQKFERKKIRISGGSDEMDEHANNAADKRQTGKNPIRHVKKYVNASLKEANRIVNGDTGEAAQKIVQEYMNRAMNRLNYELWEIGDFNSYNDHPTKYNQIDYSYDVKKNKLSQKKWKSDWT